MGSEMCIRDSRTAAQGQTAVVAPPFQHHMVGMEDFVEPCPVLLVESHAAADLARNSSFDVQRSDVPPFPLDDGGFGSLFGLARAEHSHPVRRHCTGPTEALGRVFGVR